MNTQTVCRICKKEGVRLHCITDTHLQKIYEHDTGTSLPSEDIKPMLACITCCDRLDTLYEHSNTQHTDTEVVQSDGFNCIKSEPQELLEIEMKEEPVTNDYVDETWHDNDESLKEENENCEISPRIINVKSEPEIEIEIEIGNDGMSTNEKQHTRGITSNKRVKDTTTRKKNEKTKEEKRFDCNICNKYFKTKSNLMRHLIIHSGDKPYQCTFCTKSFTQKAGLVKHIRIHTGNKPYSCAICSKAFSQKNNLVSHHNHVHAGYKPHECQICSKRFSDKSNLVVHIRTHTNEKPNKCTICSKCFTQKNDLVKHMRLHTGEKPFQCSVCEKRFSEKSSLVRHERIHTGVKPYQCNTCSKAFNQKSTLDVHNRLHTDTT